MGCMYGKGIALKSFEITSFATHREAARHIRPNLFFANLRRIRAVLLFA